MSAAGLGPHPSRGESSLRSSASHSLPAAMSLRPTDHVLQATAGKGIPFHLPVPVVGLLKLILGQPRQELVELLPGKRLDLVNKFLDYRGHNAFIITRLSQKRSPPIGLRAGAAGLSRSIGRPNTGHPMSTTTAGRASSGTYPTRKNAPRPKPRGVFKLQIVDAVG